MVADPAAVVGGEQRAGRVNVLYGGGDDVGVLAQGQAGVGESPEGDDAFGAVVLTMNVNGDAYADLVVGVPSESVGAAADAGVVHVVFGSANGLGGGRAALVLRQGAFGIPGGPEAGDRFGAAVAVNATTVDTGSAPAIAYGAPGEDVGTTADAGTAGVVAFGTGAGGVSAAAAITQNSPGISGSAEAGDRLGAAVALFQGPGGFGCAVAGVEGFTLVAGAPGEDLGAKANAGMVHVARDLARDTPLSQDVAGVDGSAENGDQFGARLALTSFCEHDGPSHVKLAVGVPTEDIGTAADAGMMHLFSTDDDELPLPERWSASENAAGVAGTSEAGDRFGSVLAFGGPWRDNVGNPLVVGVPSEDVGTARDAGSVHVFGDSSTEPRIGNIRLDQSFTGQTPQPGDRFGAALAARHDILLAGAPDDAAHTKGAVHAIAWTAIFGTPAPAQLYVPGSDGIPATAIRFGAALA